MVKPHIQFIISLLAFMVFVPTGFVYAASLNEFCEFDEDCGGYICDLNVDLDEDGENDAGICRECQGGGSYESGNGFGCYEEDGEVCATSGADKGKCVSKDKQSADDGGDKDDRATDDGNASGSAASSGLKGATQYDGKTFSFFGLVQGDNLGELIVSVYEDLAFKLIGIIIFIRLLIVSFNYISGQLGGAKIGGVGSIGEEVSNAVLAFIILTSAYVVLNTINPDLVEGKFTLEALSGSPNVGGSGQAGGGNPTDEGGGSGNDKPGEGVCSPLKRDCFGGCTQYKAFADRGAGGIVKSSWLTAIVIQESSCGKNKGPNARSGACGVGQFLKGTAAEYISKAIKNSKCGITKQDQVEFTANYCDWLKNNDEKSVCMSGLYLNELGKICKTDLFQNVAAAYNWGPGNACNSGGAKKGKCTGQSACDASKPAEPWECKGPTETKNYVRQTLFCSANS